MRITCVSFHVVITTSLAGGLHDIAVDTLMSCVVSVCEGQKSPLHGGARRHRRPLRGPSAHALSPGNRLRHATGKGRLLGRVSQDVAEEWHVAVNVCGAGQGERKKAGGKGPRGCKGQERRPAQHEGSSACRPLGRKSGTGFASGKESDKLSGLGTPASSNLNAKHDQPTAAPGSKLRVRPSFGTFSDTQSCPSGAATVSARHARCSEGRHQGGVNG